MTLDLFNAFTVTVTPQSVWWKYTWSNITIKVDINAYLLYFIANIIIVFPRVPPESLSSVTTSVLESDYSDEPATVVPAKSDSDIMFCLQSYQGLVIDRLLVYNPIRRIGLIHK